MSTPADPAAATAPVSISEFVAQDEPRFSCLVCPAKSGWWWSIFSGDGSIPGSLQRGSSARSLAEALEAAAEWVRSYDGRDERAN